MSKKQTRQNKKPSATRDLLVHVDSAQTELIDLRAVAKMFSSSLALHVDAPADGCNEVLEGLIVVAKQMHEKLVKVSDHIDDIWDLSKKATGHPSLDGAK